MLSATFDSESLNDIKNEFMTQNNCLVRAGAVNQVMNTITQKILKVELKLFSVNFIVYFRLLTFKRDQHF